MISLRKYVAMHLPASRRQADCLITDGLVSINGQIARVPSLIVDHQQTVCVDGVKLLPKEIKYAVWCYHKPKGLVTTHKDPQGRPTVFADLPKEIGRVISVGRLDINTEGLLLITNCHAFARYMELPSNGFIRTYRVKVFGHIDLKRLQQLKFGVTIEQVQYGGVIVKVEKSLGLNSWLQISICEGKNREVRKIMAYLGVKVARIIRVSYGPFKLGDLAPHQLRKAPRHLLKRFAKCFE
ncbi:MAG: rRNA pseudouridine synthase [Holosporales bacterium]|jgi:23S rRNA pseudouridine2605 synthase|nr:rRNA pseudouridine synthase [Holosporales bacterium]